MNQAQTKQEPKEDLSMYQRIYQKHVAADEEMNLQALLLPADYIESLKPNKKST